MTEPKRILLFETSALLSALSQFTDPFTHDPEALERLLQPPRPGEPPLIDAIRIPDHVLYELTGQLPFSQAAMLRAFKQAKATGDRHALDDLIDLYALASPRGEVHDPHGDQKNHIRVLLHFIANHPDSLIETEVSQAFGQRLKADFSTLSSSKPETLAQYRPTFADAFDYLGDDFKAENLRVHAGQLLMMGLITEKNFNERLGEDEKALGHKKRFYKTNDFLDQMGGRQAKGAAGNASKPSPVERLLAPDDAARIRDAEKKRDATLHSGQRKAYLTMGTFMRHPELLRVPLERYGLQLPADHAPAQSAFRPSQLQLEHYLHGGILPTDNESLLAIAIAMQVDINGFTKTSDPDHLQDYLDKQGFNEIRPTMQDLVNIRHALQAIGHATPVLDRFIQALPNAEKSLQKRFNDTCKNPQNGGIANQTELRIPHIGLPYEKVFSDALVNGALGWDEFVKLVQATDGLHQTFGAYKGTQQGDILLRPSTNLDEARILIRQEGFVGRTGKTMMTDYISRAAKAVLVDGTERRYIELPARTLLDRCRAGLRNYRFANKLYRVFEAMLYRPATMDATDLRNQAITILGEDRLVQLEKDFANRHARKSGAVQPPYRSMFAAIHTNARISRKNLGEVATAEAATRLLADYPQADIWLANHDSDLFPHENTRDATLEDSVVRQHGAWFPPVRALNEKMSGEPRLHFINSHQLLNTMQRITGHTPRASYESVKAKQFILQHQSNSWVRQIEEKIQPHSQRR